MIKLIKRTFSTPKDSLAPNRKSRPVVGLMLDTIFLSLAGYSGLVVVTYEYPEIGKQIIDFVPPAEKPLFYGHSKYEDIKSYIKKTMKFYSINSEKKAPAELAKKKTTEIKANDFSSTEEVSEYLKSVVDRLSVVSRVVGSDEIDFISKELELHVPKLKKMYQKLLEAERNRISSMLNEQKNQIIGSENKKLEEERKNLEKELNENYEAEKQTLLKSIESNFSSKLEEQVKALETQFEKEKIEFETNLTRRLQRNAKLALEQEKSGRLAKLDLLMLKLKYLQRASELHGHHLIQNRATNNMWAHLVKLEGLFSSADYRPFQQEWKVFCQEAQGHNLVTQALATVPNEVLEHGIRSVESLQMAYHPLRDEIRSLSLVPENGGLLSIAFSKFMSIFTFRKRGLVEGNDVDSILARSEYYLLIEHDVLRAAKELNQLKGWPKKVAESWLNDARDFLTVNQALSAIQTYLALKSLNVLEKH